MKIKQVCDKSQASSAASLHETRKSLCVCVCVHPQSDQVPRQVTFLPHVMA